MHAIVASHYLEGASYPVGGASRIAETVAPVIERGGGKIVVNAEVSEIVVERNRAVGVRMADGREIRAGTIISDTGAPSTFDNLLHESSGPLEKVRAKLRRIPPSPAHLCLYVGVKESAAHLGISATNLWIHPTPDHDANVEAIKADSEAPFGSLFISFPSVKDPDFERRHPDRCTVEVELLPRPRISGLNAGRMPEWEAPGRRLRGTQILGNWQARLQRELEHYVPALAGKIDYARNLSTPLSTRHFMNHRQGEMYGLSADRRNAFGSVVWNPSDTDSQPLSHRAGCGNSRCSRGAAGRCGHGLRVAAPQSDVDPGQIRHENTSSSPARRKPNPKARALGVSKAGRFAYYLTAPKVNPWTSCFWVSQPSTMIGATASREAAESFAQKSPSGLE